MVTLTHLRSMHLEVVLHFGAKKKHGFRKWGGTPNHPNLQYSRIETHDFGVPFRYPIDSLEIAYRLPIIRFPIDSPIDSPVIVFPYRFPGSPPPPANRLPRLGSHGPDARPAAPAAVVARR